MHVHLIGVCGTGMGSLAGMFKEAGHRVTGSDAGFYEPMKSALQTWGVETMAGWRAENLEPAPDLVVIGNVCRRDNPEARFAIDHGLAHVSFPQAIEERFIGDRPSYVVAGTHGKTTTTALLSHMLFEAGRDPGFLIGGVPLNFDKSFRIGGDASPFVIEGDEYDTVFYEKKPKFWRYRPWAVLLTSIEHDHIDIYPSLDAYRAAFDGFIDRIPNDGVLVAFAGDPEVRRAAARAKCRVVFYALDRDDTGEVVPVWSAGEVAPQGSAQPFDLFIGGTSGGRVYSPLSGAHNLRNALGALALAAEAARIPMRESTTHLQSFAGVKRRQELIGEATGVRVYDDFAHHPTAVRETLRGLRARHPNGRLIALFEPRSATASRRLHQVEYPAAFRSADRVFLAPVGRKEIQEDERLDVDAIVREIGPRASSPSDHDQLVEEVSSLAKPGDTVVIMSNGAFGGVHDRILARLAVRPRELWA